MACSEFFKTGGYSIANTPLDTINQSIFADGVGCINANQSSCASSCTTLTKSEQSCYTCLSQVGSCPNASCKQNNTQYDCAKTPSNICCSNAKGSCCPNAKAAISCGSCVASKGQNSISAYAECLKDHKLSSRNMIIIIVCSVIVFVILVVSIVMYVRNKKKKELADKVDIELQEMNPRFKNQISNLDIDSEVLKDTYIKLALRGASQKVESQEYQTNKYA